VRVAFKRCNEAPFDVRATDKFDGPDETWVSMGRYRLVAGVRFCMRNRNRNDVVYRGRVKHEDRWRMRTGSRENDDLLSKIE
jgi:hypothetical protein